MDNFGEWFGTLWVGVAHDPAKYLDQHIFEIIEFFSDPVTCRGLYTECLALDGTIVNSPAIRQAPLTWAPVMCDSGWAL